MNVEGFFSTSVGRAGCAGFCRGFFTRGGGAVKGKYLAVRFLFLSLALLQIMVGAVAARGATGGDDVKTTRVEFSLAPAAAYFLYREYESDKNDNIFMDISGAVGGVESKLTFMFYPKDLGFIFTPFDMAVYTGIQMTYRGQNGNSRDSQYGSLVTQVDNIFLFWARALVGPTISFFNNYRVNLLSGMGYKYTANQREDSTRYARTNHLFYVPLVLQFQYSTDGFSLLANAEYDFFVSGVQRSHAVASFDDFNNSARAERAEKNLIMPQTRGYGARAYIEINIHHITVTPFFNYFWVDDSVQVAGQYTGESSGHGYAQGTYGEPRNITIETGARLGYNF
ncbi:MAG: hypothetical protein QM529_00770 [Hydrotalea sp.]|nr:hypothetical protein [Hydrotalea sp.]